mgnify:FL=1
MEVTKTRELFLDYCKSFILLTMILTHILEECPTEAVQYNPFFYVFFEYGYMFGACAFMLSMGWTFNYARNLTPRKFVRRGLWLIVLGYVLNFLRSISDIICGDIKEIVYNLLVPDILQFAGLAMLVFAAAESARIRAWLFPIVALALTAVGYYCAPYLPLSADVESPSLAVDAVKYLLGLFYYTGIDYSYFPLLNWLIFPAVGYWVSAMYLRAKEQGRDRAFMQRACMIGYAIVAALFVADHFADNTIIALVSYDTFLQFGHNACSDLIYDVPPLDAVMASAFIVATFAALKLIIDAVKRCRPGQTWLDRCAVAFSRNINNVYIIQWLIIGDLLYPLKALNVELSAAGVCLCYFAVTAATIALTYLWDKHRKQNKI